MNYPYCTLNEVTKARLDVKNSKILRIDINLIGHFGNLVTVEVVTCHGVLFREWNATSRLGLILQCLFDLLDLTHEDGMRLSDAINIPCRVLIDRDGNIVGLGNFMEDKFVCEQDLFQFCGRSEQLK